MKTQNLTKKEMDCLEGNINARTIDKKELIVLRDKLINLLVLPEDSLNNSDYWNLKRTIGDLNFIINTYEDKTKCKLKNK